LDEPLVQVSSAGVLTYLHSDRQGSIVATTDSTGTVTNKSKYSPFGENAPIGTTFGFTTQRYDAETGLYYYKNRHYSPTLNRFLQTDPIGYGGGLNVYAYVNNDPVNLSDPLGLAPGTLGTPSNPTGPKSRFKLIIQNDDDYCILTAQKVSDQRFGQVVHEGARLAYQESPSEKQQRLIALDYERMLAEKSPSELDKILEPSRHDRILKELRQRPTKE
jgi:RHS repeat-associated protein